MIGIGPGAGGDRRRFWLVLAIVGLWGGCRPPPLAPLPRMGTCSAPLEPPPLGAWTAGPSAPTRRTGGLMMTLTGGRVLFAGGRVGGGDAPCVTDVELFEPATMAWRRLTPLPIAMCSGDGVELDDGRVFVGIQVPGPPSNWRYGEAIFLVYEPSTTLWTEVAHVPAPFNLQRVLPLGGNEVFLAGFDHDSLISAFTWSSNGLTISFPPPRTPYYGVRGVLTSRDRTVTWFLDDTSVLRSPAPDLAPVVIAAARPRESLEYAIVAAQHVIARSAKGWLIWPPSSSMWREIVPPPEHDRTGGLRATLVEGDRVDRVFIARPNRSSTSASILSIPSETWQRIASPHDVDRHFAALPDGRILAVDATGRTTLWSAAATMDLSWHRLAAVPQVLRGASVTPLADGRVLVAGGNVGDYQTSSRAIVVDPLTGAWSETGAMSTPRIHHTATLLADGRVLVAGGTDHNRIVDVTYWRSMTMPRPSDYDEGLIDHETLEVWDPRTGAWSAAGRFPVPLTEQSAVVLRDGRVAFLGGNASRRVPKRMAGGHWSLRYAMWKFSGAMVWDPATERVTDIDATPRRDHVGALVLQDGRVLALGGVPEGNEPAPLDLLQALDPRTNGFATVGTLRVSRASPLAVQLADGTVLIAGGAAGAGAAPRRAGLPIEAWAPTGTSAPALPEFDAPRDPQAARVLADGHVAIAACDRTILWNPATASWARADDLPPDSAGCRIVARGESFLAITPEGCAYELGASKR
ncbi:MAG: hypothetical protein KBG48_09950 [Kofleriaceae bacterium]|nr:hypothetical protein [Kofleriaceae bacterium]MBP9167701.1 hypothetical protein [Kofleriaceae bacterium]MBP9857802.1 hypothetical protein [Kofleriaceae bacterium]